MIRGNQLRLFALTSLFALSIIFVVFAPGMLSMGAHLAIVGFFLYGTLSPNSRLFGPIQSHTGTSSLWLTIDDGPDPEDTPAILDLLDRYEVQATFFVIGEKAEKYPELIELIHSRGHQVGNHTFTHPQSSFWCKGPRRTQEEIERCQAAVSQAMGETPTLFRAPVGHSNFFVHPVLRLLNINLIGWSSRGYDAVSESSEKVTDELFRTMKPGAIVLTHEATPIAQEVIEAVLDHAKQKGWKWINPRELPQSENC